nr:hypothetical protein [Tanacetum cinerariifolium]
HSNRKDAPIRSPTGIETGLEEHLAPMERSNKIPIGDQDRKSLGYKVFHAQKKSDDFLTTRLRVFCSERDDCAEVYPAGFLWFWVWGVLERRDSLAQHYAWGAAYAL